MKQAEGLLERGEGDHIVLKHNKKNTEATNYLSRTNMPATVQGAIVHIGDLQNVTSAAYCLSEIYTAK